MARRLAPPLVLALALLVAACAPMPRGDASPPTGGASTQVFESEEFVVTFARHGDTAESLAQRILGTAAKAWMIEDYNRTATFRAGQEVVVPKRPWNLAGVDPEGYQLVPVLVYHNVTQRAQGRLVLAASAFEEQMRYLKTHGYRVVSLSDLHDFITLRRQLPRRAVVLTFDDGYRSFLDHVHPVLRALGFTATLFVYTDFVGASRTALTWGELRQLASEGLDVQAHSKTHDDLRRRPAESDADYARRVETELGQPQALFRRHLGRPARILAYPYGAHDEEIIRRAREHGYEAGFSVRREGNPSFVFPFRAYRSQIYSTMTLEDFARNLAVFAPEPVR